jgi:NitT/TauT family transport system ATP-binding protein
MTALEHDSQAGSQAAGAGLAARGVTRVFKTRSGEVPALGPVDLEVEPGEFVAVVGPSGCGKTTLLRILGGLASVTEGVVTYRGKPVSRPVDGLGIVFQRPVLLEWRSVLRNVTLQAEIRGTGSAEERRTAARELLARVGLAGVEERYPWELSGGQQQRVALCRALIHDPSLLLMDEPFGSLDAITREALQADLERLWEAERPTVVFVTHDVVEAVGLADRVVVMEGRPGTFVKDINIDVSRPRAGHVLDHEKLQQYAREVRALLKPVAGDQGQ